LSPSLIDALFNFGSANAGKTFLIFAVGPGGTSRNLTQGQTPAGCVFGNEQGVQVTFTCNSTTTPGPTPTPPNIATITRCDLRRAANGKFTLDIFGTGIRLDATVTVGGVSATKIKQRDIDTGSNTVGRLTVTKKVCGSGSAGIRVPGIIVVTNIGPNGGASAPFNCLESCAINQ
jgi:hypothetical protein